MAVFNDSAEFRGLGNYSTKISTKNEDAAISASAMLLTQFWSFFS